MDSKNSQEKDKVTIIDPKKIRAIIDFEPHEFQLKVLRDDHRFIALNWGRRSGKTLLAAYIALRHLFTSNQNIWIVAPTYDLSRRCWDYLTKWIPLLNKEFGKFFTVNKSSSTIESASGSKLELKSADNPDSLLGIGLNLLIIDEAALVPEEVWRRHLRPTLTDRYGRAVFISTPYGKNWFYDLMLKGVDTDERFKDYTYYHMKTVDNSSIPHIKEEIEQAKFELPLATFMQEYEAEFIEGAGSVFRGVRDCVYDTSFTGFPFYDEPYDKDHVYQGGLDLARLTDFTVATIVDKSSSLFKVVAIDRFNEIDWKLQKPRLNLFSQKYLNPPINSEINNIGDVVIEDLGGNFTPFQTTNASKKELINNLAILIEQKKILIPNIPLLINELEAYSYEVSSTGVVKYSAPVGYHDDMVMSLALAVKDLRFTHLPNQQQRTYTTKTSYRYEEY